MERAQHGSRTALWMALGTTGVVMLPVLIAAPSLVAFFNNKPEVIEFGTLFLRYISPFYLVMCIYQVYAGALRGAGNSRVPMILMLLSFVAFRQAYLYVVSRWMPGAILPIALSYPAGWLACSVSTLIYYSRARLSKSRLVEDDPPAKTA